MLHFTAHQRQPEDVAIVKKTISKKDKDVVKTAAHIPDSEGHDLPLFHRNELVLGKLVGSGSFSEVYEISSFGSQSQKKRRNAGSSCLTSSSAFMEPSRRRKRQELIESHEEHKKEMYSGKVLKSRYVIKHLHPKLVADPKLFRRAVKDLATEVSIMSSLDHAHIVQIRATAIGGSGALSDGKHDSYFLVLDQVFGTLDDRIEQWNQEKILQGPSYYLDCATNDTKVTLKANYALQIASALNYLHERRIIFRDLKPQNIGFKEVNLDHPERDVLALFDFGLSRKLPSPEKSDENGLYRMSLVGTRRYMCPELVINRTYDARADTYSWALVFYELITQTRPYDGIQRNEHKEFICVQGKRPKLYSYYGLPPVLERLLRFGWAQDVTKRPEMVEVCETLQTYLAGTIHEGCVRQPTEPRPTVVHDDSIASLTSDSTHRTDQTVSTANSFTMDDEEKMKPTAHDVSETGAAVGDAVPRAIAVSSASSSSSRLPDECSNETGEPTHKRASICERCVNVFRRSFKGSMLFHF